MAQDRVKALIGIDVGTQGVRVCIFRVDGKLLAKEIINFTSTRRFNLVCVEQDPLEWWNTTINALKKALKRSCLQNDDIIALSYACTSCTVVFLDRDGIPIRPAILWADTRSIEEAKQIQKIGGLIISQKTGYVSPEWYLPKVLWVKKHETDSYRNASYIVEQIDYFTYKLTGKWTLGLNHIISKWNYNPAINGWDDSFLMDIGLEGIKEKWPKTILPIGAVIGYLDSKVARETGLSENLLVIQGGMDSTAGMLGLGAFEIGEIGINHGTSTVIQCLSDRFIEGVNSRPNALIEGLYLIGGGEATTGAAVQWFVELLSYPSSKSLWRKLIILDKEVSAVPPGSEGLVFLEHLQGSRNHRDPYSRGVMAGITLQHTPAHILRAIYEGISFGIRQFLETLQKHDYVISRISIGGGLANSQIAVQILSDVCGYPIYRPVEKEYTALGAALLAGWGAGIFKNIREGIQNMVHYEEPIHPHTNYSKVYDYYYRRYCQLYDCVKELLHELANYPVRRLKD